MFLVGCPSGQWERTVNPPALPSVVQIHYPPQVFLEKVSLPNKWFAETFSRYLLTVERLLRKLLACTVVCASILIFASPQTHASEVTGYFYKRPSFTNVSLGQSSACAVSDAGEVWCWGSNNKYQSASKLSNFESTPFRLIGIDDALQVAVGREHACALLKTKRVVCWGSNEFGQLGTGFEPATLANSPFPEYVNGLVDATSIYAGDDHNCAITSDKDLFCWGSNSRGQIGQLFKDESRQINGRAVVAQAERVNISQVVDAGLGTTHSCVITVQGYVYCFGSNLYGQLAQGWGIEKSYKPLIVGSIVDAKRIDASANSTCITDKAKSMRCWGAGESGQLGNLDTGDLALPTNQSLSLGKYVIDEFSVGNRSTCAKLDNSVVYCWGSTLFGQVGSSNLASVSLSPFSSVQYPLSDATQIESGGDFSCVLTGNIWCWGRNNLGQLGQMTNSTFSTYAQINNPRWDLAPNSITHTSSNNVITLNWPQIGASQTYARVESKNGKLICQTNTALTCDFIPESLGRITYVLFLQVKDINGVNQAARAEYSIEVKSLTSAVEAKIQAENDAIEAAANKLIEEERAKKLAKLMSDLKIVEVKMLAAQNKLEKVSDLLAEATDSYLAAKDRSSAATDQLSAALNSYIAINKQLAALNKLYKRT